MIKPFPLITAHTGCMGTPDNTLLSIETGLNLGVDIIEEDIRITSDGVLVLSHDDNVHLADGTECWISQMNYAELSKLDIKAHNGAPGETIRILSLESVLPILQACGKIMNLDLKSDACIEPISNWIEKNRLLEQVILSGCETERAKIVQHVNPRIRKLLNVDPALFLTKNYEEAAKICCEDAKSTACFGINLNYRVVQAELLHITASNNLDVCIWTVNEEAQMKHFIEMGVRSITSRNAAALLKLKQELMRQNGADDQLVIPRGRYGKVTDAEQA
ncbi:glycerophosphoryl diester phosphodiesterase [Paenibacillus sp. yr247]|uniref:glycerophosphodiester phosphodiesterase n=1 Tax=Paenibacillus sp. yr247 TaxID=1761880 RepID=UPI000889CD21|nr:glycerophosphodiester phosphodiesterase family protein [Paenibacillus sp. yr247]SDN71582.1 glycerophosphoryl diester phosphodiesterase [Paenibacillus sp. yr247]